MVKTERELMVPHAPKKKEDYMDNVGVNSRRQTTTTATTNIILRFSIRNCRTVLCDLMRMGTIARRMHGC